MSKISKILSENKIKSIFKNLKIEDLPNDIQGFLKNTKGIDVKTIAMTDDDKLCTIELSFKLNFLDNDNMGRLLKLKQFQGLYPVDSTTFRLIFWF